MTAICHYSDCFVENTHFSSVMKILTYSSWDCYSAVTWSCLPIQDLRHGLTGQRIQNVNLGYFLFLKKAMVSVLYYLKSIKFWNLRSFILKRFYDFTGRKQYILLFMLCNSWKEVRVTLHVIRVVFHALPGSLTEPTSGFTKLTAVFLDGGHILYSEVSL